MMYDELITYLKQAAARAVPEEQAIASLLNAGWRMEDIEASMHFIRTGGTFFEKTLHVVPAVAPVQPSDYQPLVLIVDDEPNFLEIFSAKLTAAGFRTAIAKNGKEAVASVGKLSPDLVLMDIHLPGETGTDIALAIKQSAQTQHARIAFLTNLKDPWPAMTGDHGKIAKELGMEDFIQKTDDLDHIVQRVRELAATKNA